MLYVVLSTVFVTLTLGSSGRGADGGLGLDNGLGLTPQMGWNSWNIFHCGINSTLIASIIDAMTSSGLQDVGYEYVNLDDCWQSARYPNGTIMPDPDTFPDGLIPLIDQAHTAGLLFGVYSDAGNKTCQGRPGSLGYETIDADTYAAWGVDYLKYDNCNNDGIPPEERYPIMTDALNATGRPIFYSMCEWGQDDPWNWAQSVGNSWRTTGDIQDNWSSMLKNFDNNGPASAAGPGGWNDPDMLEVGNGGMTTTEYITHFSLWCLAKAPLLVGCDIRNMDDDTTMILTNKEAIAINQDSLGVQGDKKVDSGDTQVYGGELANNDFVVLFLNRGSSSADISVTWDQLGLDSTQEYTLRDIWQHEDIGQYTGNYTATAVASHGVVFLRMTPSS